MPAKQILLLDACVVINLEATAQFETIAEGLRTQFCVTRQASLEVGSLRVDVDGVVRAIPVNLGPHVQSGALQLMDLRSDELALYVELAAELGDGEAASIAIALSRNLEIATDDRKARRACLDRGLPEPVRTTDLIHEYCEQHSLAAVEIGTLLRNIRDRASFVPPRTDPNVKWWTVHIDT